MRPALPELDEVRVPFINKREGEMAGFTIKHDHEAAGIFPRVNVHDRIFDGPEIVMPVAHSAQD